MFGPYGYNSYHIYGYDMHYIPYYNGMHNSFTNYDNYTDTTRHQAPVENTSLIEIILISFGPMLGIFLLIPALAAVLVYTFLRIALAPLSSVIDICVNWGNLHHARSKKALQYQLLILALLAIGGIVFGARVFNPFSMGTLALVVAIITVSLSILITTAIARYYASKFSMDKIRPFVEEFDQEAFSNSLWSQVFFGQDDVFTLAQGICDYQALFKKPWSDEEKYTLFLKEFSKLDCRGRLNIEQAEGRANFNFICHRSGPSRYAFDKYNYLTKVVKAMLLLDNAGLLNEHGRNFINKSAYKLNDDLVTGYITECNLLKKSGRYNAKNRAIITEKLKEVKDAKDAPPMTQSLQRKSETYYLIAEHLLRDAATITLDYCEDPLDLSMLDEKPNAPPTAAVVKSSSATNENQLNHFAIG